MVIWWTAKFEMLYKFTNGKDDLREQDPRFRNRTKLFKDQLEQGNWSVLLSDLRESDQSQYKCEIYKKKEEIDYLVKFDLLHLFVTVSIDRPANITVNTCVTEDQKPVLKRGIDRVICQGSNCTVNYRAGFNQDGCYYVCIQNISQATDSSKNNLYLEFSPSGLIDVELSSDDVCPTPGSSEAPAVDQQQFNTTQGPGPSTRARVGLGIGILVAVFVAGVGIYIFLKRRKQNTRTINRNESSNGVLLTEVTCPGETRGFVTAPEHQDGAAGEQNLLRNGTVQH